jgi:serine/threonine protein kinase
METGNKAVSIGDASAKKSGVHSISGSSETILLNKTAIDAENMRFELTRKPNGKYRNKRTVGRGGMKVIVRSWDKDTSRDIAMAVMLKKDNFASSPHFIQEARIAANLEHPNIVPVHDIGLDEAGSPYFTMKLISGESLASIIGKLAKGNEDYQKKYSLFNLLQIFQKVCDAIAFAHSKGVIHLDIKPENIQVGEYGEVLVLDWGLAKILSSKNAPGDSALTQPADKTGKTAFVLSQKAGALSVEATMDGVIKGTPGYMAPEQALGMNREKDCRTDIFSLGATLYSILTLLLPFQGENFTQVMVATEKGDLIPPRKRSPELEIPKALESVVMKAMALKPGDRYQSVDELSSEISSYLGGFATMAEQAGLARQLWLLVCRHRAVSMIAAVLALVAISSGLWIRHSQINELRARAESAESAQKAAEAAHREDAAKLKLFEEEKKLVEGWLPVVDLDFAKGDKLDPRFKVYGCRDLDLKAYEELPEPDRISVAGGILQLLPCAWRTIVRWEEDISEEVKVEVTLAKTEKIDFGIDISGDTMDGYRLRIVHTDGGNLNRVEFETVFKGYWELLHTCNVVLSPLASDYSFCLWRSGNTFNATLDGKKILEYEDPLAPRGKRHRSLSVSRYSGQGTTMVRSLRIFHRQEANYVDILEPGRVLMRNGYSKSALEYFEEIVRQPRDESIRQEAAYLAALAVPVETFEKKRSMLQQIGNDMKSRFRSRALNVLCRLLAERGDGLGAGDVAMEAVKIDPESEAPMLFMETIRPWMKGMEPEYRQATLQRICQLPLKNVRLSHSGMSNLEPLSSIRPSLLDFGGNQVADLSPLRGMQLVQLDFWDNQVTDLSPLRGMQLVQLDFWGNKITDLSPLRGMPLVDLDFWGNQVTDLTPLRGMPLAKLDCWSNQIADLTPLNGMPIAVLNCSNNQISDLSPLKGIPLAVLNCSSNQISDLTPLRGMPLTMLNFTGNQVTDISPLQGMPLVNLDIHGVPLNEKNVDVLRSLKLKSLEMDLASAASIEFARSMSTLEKINGHKRDHVDAMLDDLLALQQNKSVDLRKYGTRKGSFLYLAVPLKVERQEAVQFASAQGGCLASPSNEAKANDLMEYVRNMAAGVDFHFGLHVDPARHMFAWDSGEILDYEKWDNSYSAARAMAAGEALLGYGGEFWFPHRTGMKHYFIIEWKAGPGETPD